MFYKSILLSLFIIVPQIVTAAPLEVAGFNIEAIDSSPEHIAAQMAANKNIEVWGLSEAQKKFIKPILKSLNRENKSFDYVYGSTGNKQRLQIYYNTTRFTLLEKTELHHINIGGRVRAPLVALLHDNLTDKTFYFVVNHLYRANSKARSEQSRLLNEWAQSMPYPVIAVGDYNYDLSPRDISKHDPGYDVLTENGVFEWLKPNPLLPTQCSRHKSILDFIFVSGEAKHWARASKILNPEQHYCPDNQLTSDHRPLKGLFDIQ